jgi:hypothetical protein
MNALYLRLENALSRLTTPNHNARAWIESLIMRSHTNGSRNLGLDRNTTELADIQEDFATVRRLEALRPQQTVPLQLVTAILAEMEMRLVMMRSEATPLVPNANPIASLAAVY